MKNMIYHITSREAWMKAGETGAYTAPSLETEGFIHCSKLDQVLRVANTFYRGQPGLVMLEIDMERLSCEVRLEPGTDKPEELFPHVCGEIPVEAVVRLVDLPPGPDGIFRLATP